MAKSKSTKAKSVKKTPKVKKESPKKEAPKVEEQAKEAETPKSENVTPVEVEIRDVESVHPDNLPYAVMDEAYTSAIIESIEGVMSGGMDKWVYEFNMDGKKVRGLSWLGSKEAAFWFRQKKLLVLSEDAETPPKVEHIKVEDEMYVRVTLHVKDLRTGAGAWATVTEPFYKKTKEGKKYGSFMLAEKVALSKAQRNAYTKIMPESMLLQFYDHATKQGRNQQLQPSKNQMRLSTQEMKSMSLFLSKLEKVKSPEDLEAAQEYIDRNVGKPIQKDGIPLNGRMVYHVKQIISAKRKKLAKEEFKNAA